MGINIEETSAKRYKTIVISDLHMGSIWSATTQVIEFIRQNSCERLILCGDIIDGWLLARKGKRAKWGSEEREFISLVSKIAEESEVIYIKGNHDDFLTHLIPMQISGIQIVDQCIIDSSKRRILVTHGDRFDRVNSSLVWLSKIGEVCYSLLLRINGPYNRLRQRRKLPYRSIASAAKRATKRIVARFSNYENSLVKYTKEMQCDAIICGHIHHPEIKMIDEILYLNSGDWVESLSALVEDFSGNWSLKIDLEQQQNHLKEMIEK